MRKKRNTFIIILILSIGIISFYGFKKYAKKVKDTHSLTTQISSKIFDFNSFELEVDPTLKISDFIVINQNSGKIIYKNGKNLKKIKNEYGHCIFELYYKGKRIFEFGHFKKNNWQTNEYKLLVKFVNGEFVPSLEINELDSQKSDLYFKKSSELEHLKGIEIYLFKNECINKNSYLNLSEKEFELFKEKYNTSLKNIPINYCKNYINIDSCEIEDKPFLSLNDIEYYNWDEKTIYLTKKGKDKLSKLKIPIRGIPYVIKVKDEVFFGAWFWNIVSSEGCDRVFSMVSPNLLELNLNFGIGNYKCGKDPRNDINLLNTLISNKE